MTLRPAHFKQIDVTRAIKGAVAADMEVGAAYITPEGGIMIIAKGEQVTSAKGDIDKMLSIR
jgi:hypothetical protein